MCRLAGKRLWLWELVEKYCAPSLPPSQKNLWNPVAKGDAFVPRGHCVVLPEMSVWEACGSPCGHFPQHQRPGPVPGWLKYPKRGTSLPWGYP